MIDYLVVIIHYLRLTKIINLETFYHFNRGTIIVPLKEQIIFVL